MQLRNCCTLTSYISPQNVSCNTSVFHVYRYPRTLGGDMDAVMLASTPSSMDIIGTMGQQAEAELIVRSELSDVPEEMPPPYGSHNTDHWLVRDTTGELLIALESLPKYQALIATVNEALAESTNAASLLQIATRRMLVVRRAARVLEAQLAEERALAAAKLQLAARRRAESKAEAAREAEQHVEDAVVPVSW